MQNINFSKISKIHFVGIGGSSMSGLAQIMLDKGVDVSGSDLLLSDETSTLQSKGAKINSPHDGSVVSTYLPDLVVFTVAVHEDNPEIFEAKKLGIPTIDRSDFLGLLMSEYRFRISVAGTHGKTTTTSMISYILLENQLDPSIHIGGTLPLIGGNTHIGSGSYFVTEACEYCDSFLKLTPNIAVVLNIELDHVDYFKSLSQLKDSFKAFIASVPKAGCAIVCADDSGALSASQDAECRIITYGIDSKDANWSAKDIFFDNKGRASYTLEHACHEVCRISLGTVGIHNVRNSLAAIATAFELGLDPSECVKPLQTFTGAKRRFELKGILDGTRIVDDYAHHPTEILTTLEAAKMSMGKGRIIVAFQPHTYTRTRELLELFSTAFKNADKVIIADIYASRETDPGDINSEMLAFEIDKVSKNCVYIGSFEEIAEYIKKEVSDGDLVITMGAGDIYKVANILLETANNK